MKQFRKIGNFLIKERGSHLLYFLLAPIYLISRRFGSRGKFKTEGEYEMIHRQRKTEWKTIGHVSSKAKKPGGGKKKRNLTCLH